MPVFAPGQMSIVSMIARPPEGGVISGGLVSVLVLATEVSGVSRRRQGHEESLSERPVWMFGLFYGFV